MSALTIDRAQHAQQRSVSFSPPDRGGVLLGLRWSQLILVIAAMVALLGLFSSTPVEAVGWGLILLAAVCMAFIPVEDRLLVDWAPVLIAYGWQKFTKQTLYVGGPGQMASREVRPTQPVLPGALSRCRFYDYRLDGGQSVGIIHDTARGELITVLRADGGQFAMLETGEQQARIDAWERLLTLLSSGAGDFTRLQWSESTLPGSAEELLRHWRQHGQVGPETFPARAYESLLDEAGPQATQHQTWIAFAWSIKQHPREIKAAGGGQSGTFNALCADLGKAEEAIRQANLQVVGWLPGRQLAETFRAVYDPRSTAEIQMRGGAGSKLPDGVDIAQLGPMAQRSDWDYVRTDSAFHRTLWVTSWPRVHSPAGFLAPLLLGAIDVEGAMRTVTVIAEPLTTRKAAQAVEHRRMRLLGLESDRKKLRKARGQRSNVDAQRVEDADLALVQGAGAYRFTGLVRVTVPAQRTVEDALDLLDQAESDVVILAGQSRLELRPLYAQQDAGLGATLPLARKVA